MPHESGGRVGVRPTWCLLAAAAAMLLAGPAHPRDAVNAAVSTANDRFVATGDGVEDRLFPLVWRVGVPKPQLYADALKACAALGPMWRLPVVGELHTVHIEGLKTRCGRSRCGVSSSFQLPGRLFWAQDARSLAHGWAVDLGERFDLNEKKKEKASAHALCVRNAAVDSSDGTSAPTGKTLEHRPHKASGVATMTTYWPDGTVVLDIAVESSMRLADAVAEWEWKATPTLRDQIEAVLPPLNLRWSMRWPDGDFVKGEICVDTDCTPMSAANAVVALFSPQFVGGPYGRDAIVSTVAIPRDENIDFIVFDLAFEERLAGTRSTAYEEVLDTRHSDFRAVEVDRARAWLAMVGGSTFDVATGARVAADSMLELRVHSEEKKQSVRIRFEYRANAVLL